MPKVTARDSQQLTAFNLINKQKEGSEMNEMSFAFIDAMMSLAAEHWPFYMEGEYMLEFKANVGL